MKKRKEGLKKKIAPFCAYHNLKEMINGDESEQDFLKMNILYRKALEFLADKSNEDNKKYEGALQKLEDRTYGVDEMEQVLEITEDTEEFILDVAQDFVNEITWLLWDENSELNELHQAGADEEELIVKKMGPEKCHEFEGVFRKKAGARLQDWYEKNRKGYMNAAHFFEKICEDLKALGVTKAIEYQKRMLKESAELLSEFGVSDECAGQIMDRILWTSLVEVDYEIWEASEDYEMGPKIEKSERHKRVKRLHKNPDVEWG